MPELKHYWVVSVIQRFDKMTFDSNIQFGLPVTVKTEGPCQLFLPVFESREEAIAWNNGSESNIYEMQEVDNAG